MASHEDDHTSRRTFLAAGGALIAAAAAPPARGRVLTAPIVRERRTQDDTPQAGPQITPHTIAEAEKLAAVEFSPQERELMARDIGEAARGYIERRRFYPENSLAPATVFDPRLPDVTYQIAARFKPSAEPAGPLPANDEDIALAPVTEVSAWIRSRELTSERLTNIYLKRLKRFGPGLECVVTLTEDRALAQAREADREIAAGKYRGPLHGIPWGAKDLLDTKGIRTSWGAMPYRNRVPDSDAAVVKMLDEAGAVLVAKLTLGALAYGDIWFGGRTNNPWNPEQGSSGSSAGSAAATAAGLVAFGIGTETLGSIVSPCTRCGTTGLRPTFGRVPRTGAMALCWSLDKIGPIARTVEDCMLVLHAINGYDAGDPSSLDMPIDYDASQGVAGMRVGFHPSWFEGRGVSDVDRHALETVREIGAELIEVELPDLPYGALRTILNAEAATAFEELTLNNRDDELVWQEPQAWPNTFRKARFIPAIEFIQADRLRRHVMRVMHDLLERNRLEAIISPNYAAGLLLITNSTGHPSLTIRAGFNEGRRGGPRTPQGITMCGRLFGEGRLCNLGLALERALDVWHERPPLSG